MPRRTTSRTTSPRGRKPKPWITVNAFLAAEQSRGPGEAARGEATNFAASDLDILTLLSILQSTRNGALRKITCIPTFRLCFFGRSDSKQVIMRHSAENRCASAPRGYALITDIRAGVVVTDLLGRREPQLWLPDRFHESLIECERLGKRFCICNVGLYSTDLIASGHAGALIFDLRFRVIERYEPGARNITAISDDHLIEVLFINHLPDWKYTGIIGGVQTRATDSHGGMCVTFSFLYTLLRILNPDRSPHEIAHFMVRGSTSEIKERTLRLNRWMMNRLRRHQRGSLRYRNAE